MPMGVDDDGNDYTGGDFRAYNLFGGFEIGALNLEAEYMNGEADIPGASNEEHDGYMIQAAYTVRNPADGIWEFVYRYSTVEGSTPDTVNAKEVFRRAPISDPRADGLHQHYIGLNYLIQGHDTKLMFGYEINTIEDAGRRRRSRFGGGRISRPLANTFLNRQVLAHDFTITSRPAPATRHRPDPK